MANPAEDRRALQPYLGVAKDLEVEMARALQEAVRDIDRKLVQLAGRSGIGAAVRADQLRSVRARLLTDMAQLWARLEAAVVAARYEAAAAAARAEAIYTSELFKAAHASAIAAQLEASQEASARARLDVLASRLVSSRIELSRSVYRNVAFSNGLLDRLINSALARGLSWRELAKEVRFLIRPDVPGGISYAAKRLARTEINNAFHAMQARYAAEEPWVDGALWNLSGSHPKPDACDEYADGEHFPGGDPGVFRPSEVPRKPHPQCLCFITPVTVSPDDFVRLYLSGQYDSYMAQYL